MFLRTLLCRLQVLVAVVPLDTPLVYIAAACTNSVWVILAIALPIPKRPLVELVYGTRIGKRPVRLWRRSSIVPHVPGHFGNLGRSVLGAIYTWCHPINRGTHPLDTQRSTSENVHCHPKPTHDHLMSTMCRHAMIADSRGVYAR